MLDLRHEIVTELRETKKYRDLCPETLERIATWALERYPAKTALKAAKRKLHQVYGAYMDAVDVARVEALVDRLPQDPEEPVLKATCREILALHASTAERLPYLETLFPRLFAGLPVIRGVADVACGLNPFTRPWMGLERQTCYWASDINERLTATIDCFFRKAGYAGSGEARDVVNYWPEKCWDMVLLLKVLPCLEQQQKGFSEKLLQHISARRIVASFPAKSLGGHEKGMFEQYRAFIERLHPVNATVETDNETYYLLDNKDYRPYRIPQDGKMRQ